MGAAIARWREQLASWAIPEEITSAAVESPWTAPVKVFANRVDHAIAHPDGQSWQLALAALQARGTVLDVGAGAGAASLPLAPSIDELIAVDTSPAMLDELLARARQLNLPARTIVGRWPDVADQTPVADVVTCSHVCYNVGDLDLFAQALTEHARRRVVVELTQTHPLAPMNPLWERLHGLTRPTGPTATDAVAVLRETGILPHVRTSWRPPRPGYGTFDDLVEMARRQLCLPPARTPELISALRDLGVDPDQPRELGADRLVVTLWWDIN